MFIDLKIKHNRCRCRICATVIESKHCHDYVRCDCGAIFTDGGREYIRRGGDFNLIEDLTQYYPREKCVRFGCENQRMPWRVLDEYQSAGSAFCSEHQPEIV